jgi:hypothetical protein
MTFHKVKDDGDREKLGAKRWFLRRAILATSRDFDKHRNALNYLPDSPQSALDSGPTSP